MSAKHRILVVDDEPDIADLFSMLLESRGHACQIAATGSEALAQVAAFQPTVILLDIGLPDFDGYRIARHVRLHHGNSIYIAAVTGWGQREDRDRALEAGIDEHFTKPVDSTLLLDMLARAAKPRA